MELTVRRLIEVLEEFGDNVPVVVCMSVSEEFDGVEIEDIDTGFPIHGFAEGKLAVQLHIEQ